MSDIITLIAVTDIVILLEEVSVEKITKLIQPLSLLFD